MIATDAQDDTPTLASIPTDSDTIIGAWDVAAIMNRSPFSDSYTAFFRILSYDSADTTDSMLAGRLFRDGIAQWYASQTGHTLTDCAEYAHIFLPYFTCHPHYTVDSGCKLVRVVYSNSSKGWGDTGNGDDGDAVPEHIRLQVQAEMEITMCRSADVVVFLAGFVRGGNRFRIYRLHHDEDQAAEIVEAVRKFWDEHVWVGIPPERAPAPPARTGAVMLSPTSDAEELAKKRAAANEQIKHWQRVEDEADEALQEMVGEADGIAGVARWSPGNKTTSWKNVAESANVSAEIVAKFTKQGKPRWNFVWRGEQ